MINQEEIKKYITAVADLERQKQEISDSMKDLLDKVSADGINIKAFKQVVKNVVKRKDDFCPYVDALCEYTEILFKQGRK
jgi:uncharacterized protein (UPF0335 family)